MKKTLNNSDVSGAKKNVTDLEVVGDGDTFQLLCKASSQSEGWMKSTKAMETPTGCVVQVTTQQLNRDGTYSIAEALTFVPGVKITSDKNSGRKLVSSAAPTKTSTPVLIKD
jgi:outer membrane receptor for Fe3+-dicitrate